MNVRFFKDSDKDWLLEHISGDLELRSKWNFHGQPTLDDFYKTDAHNYIFICEVDGEKAGVIKLSMHMNGVLYINDIFTDMQFRGKGVATKLIETAIEFIQQEYLVVLVYALTVENNPMEELFKKLGFQNEGTYKGFLFRDGKRVNQSYFVKHVKK